jgi:energy-coupling factor transporter ATP-binding protein EcfA2
MSDFDFQDYLSAIALHYGQQRDLYTLTDALLPLEARSVEREEDDREKRVEQFPVLAGLRKYALGDGREHVLLAGRPGSGKSTALRQLVMELAADGLVPVLVQLKGDRTMPELIKAEFRARKVRVTDEQIEDWLLADRLVLLLDGVNEIPNDDLRRSLAQFREDNRTVPMIFTTRDLSLGGDLGIGKRLEMKPLSEGQLREFVGKYLPEQGEKLLGQLRDRLREIAETPLLLKMLCDVFGQTGEIPPNKGELFRLFDRDYERIKKGVEYVPVSENFWLFKAQILQHLAFATIQAAWKERTEPAYTFSRDRVVTILEDWLRDRGMADAPTRAALWIKDLVNYHLLQDAAEPGEIEFHHQLFQEYYAAKALLGMFADKHPDVVEPERFQHFYLNYLKWTESVAIGLSLMEDENTAVDLVKQASDVDLMLGARLAGEVRSDFQENTIASVNYFIEKHQLPEWLSISVLGKTQSSYILPRLLKSIENDNVSVRDHTYGAFSDIKSERIYQKYFEIFRQHALKERSPAHRSLAMMQVNRTQISINPFMSTFSLICLDEETKSIYNSLRQNSQTRQDFLNKCCRTIEQLGDSTEDLDLCSMSTIFLILDGGDDIFFRLADVLRKQKNPYVRRRIVEAIWEFTQRTGAPEFLPDLRKLLIEDKQNVVFSIEQIQSRCKFYNYKIFHSPPAKPQLTQPSPQATTINQYPNVTEVKIIEHIDNYHASPPRDPPP